MVQSKLCLQSMSPAISLQNGQHERQDGVRSMAYISSRPSTHQHPLTAACMPIPSGLMIGFIKSWFYELLGQLTYHIPSSAALCLPFRASVLSPTYHETHSYENLPSVEEDAGHHQHHQPQGLSRNEVGVFSTPLPSVCNLNRRSSCMELQKGG
ncbi:hypothetical protein BU25DRAFT_128205 [Macroventuria anomochaeta]|uniref:Uncharacterized protein n=1 Tax=Macroventuria anomochaeta TaxID=301207 RepID=A0ACB6RSD0_9PLEO|nr:uncharacterized protein BU25DRAFT_128205 [Macroventuria anomochaeta]KAF2624890.1 hypothetical protein BU25DRAFT_128205 [Macroventuria anomochaeta]